MIVVIVAAVVVAVAVALVVADVVFLVVVLLCDDTFLVDVLASAVVVLASAVADVDDVVAVLKDGDVNAAGIVVDFLAAVGDPAVLVVYTQIDVAYHHPIQCRWFCHL